MKTFVFSISAAVLLSVAPAANSQFEPIPSDHKRTSLDGMKRHLYEQTSRLPDELALSGLLTVMGDPKQPDDVRKFNVDLVQQNMGMSQGEASRFLQYLIRINRDYQKDLYRLQMRMACPTERPRKSGDEVFSLFEMMYAARRALLTQYLGIVASDLSEDQYKRFYAWLQEKKLEITHYTTHHQQAYEAAGANPDTQLDQMCRRFMMAAPYVN